jgi:hypothetical protein
MCAVKSISDDRFVRGISCRLNLEIVHANEIHHILPYRPSCSFVKPDGSVRLNGSSRYPLNLVILRILGVRRLFYRPGQIVVHRSSGSEASSLVLFCSSIPGRREHTLLSLSIILPLSFPSRHGPNQFTFFGRLPFTAYA